MGSTVGPRPKAVPRAQSVARRPQVGGLIAGLSDAGTLVGRERSSTLAAYCSFPTFRAPIHADAVLRDAEEAAHEREGVEAVPRKDLEVRGGMGDHAPPEYPVVLGYRREVPDDLSGPVTGDHDPPVHVPGQRVGRQPAPDGGVPLRFVGLRELRVNKRTQPVHAS